MQQPNYTNAWLIDLSRTDQPSYRLHDGDTTIGRRADNDIVLTHPTISRYHAMIRCLGNSYILMDRGANTPITINGKRMTEAQSLFHNDQIALGDVYLRFVTS